MQQYDLTTFSNMKQLIPEAHHIHIKIIIGANFEFACFNIAVKITELLIVTNITTMEFFTFMYIIP